MDAKHEVREFLTSRRARVTPEQVGLPAGGARRVPGLRRGEVAELAGISVEYYAKLERGALAGASGSVLESVARALRLDEAERRHLMDLARAADGAPVTGRPRHRNRRRPALRQDLRWVLDAITDAVAFIRNDVQDLLGVNDLGRAFFAPVIGAGGRTPNLARFQFLDPAAGEFYPDWEQMAQMCVATMRAEAGRNPHHKGLQDLVGELSTRSETFRQLWASHDVRIHSHGTKRFHHPEVGELVLAYEELAITADEGLTLYIYSAEPGSETHQKLRMLGSLHAEHTPSPVSAEDAQHSC